MRDGPVNPYLVGAVIIACLMLLVWLISLIISDVSIVDIAWGSGFVLVAWATAITSGEWGPVTVVMVGATTLWGLRLSGYLAWRNLGHGEDPRYARMRQARGPSFRYTSLIIVFGLQGLLMWVISIPQQATSGSTAQIGVLTAVGMAVWAVGLAWETAADLQLARFKANPDNQGKVLDSGVWRFSRHPNYFGDFTVWWGLYLIAASAGAWWTFFAPAVMSFLLLRVSGVTLLEKSLTKTKPQYADYVARTNAFFPGPPRRRS